MLLSRSSRREFLKNSALALGSACAAPAVVPSTVFGATAPSNRITLASIGTGNRGTELLQHFLKLRAAQVVAVCDVNRGSFGYRDLKQFCGREPAQKLVEEHYAARRASGSYRGCAAYVDLGDVLDRNDIDAVVIAVPDHSHAEIAIAAAIKGKDIYGEKPLALTIDQGSEMVHMVRKHGRIFQTGSHERSNPVSRFACELVRNGRIGEVKKVVTFVGYHNKVGPGPGWQPMPVPDGFDYDRWLGPAPLAPYHKDRCLYRFRFIYDYSGGQITNFGAHSIDLAQWGLGRDLTGPTEVELLDAKFLPKGSLYDAATETSFRCRYGNGVELLSVMDKSSVGVRFEGTEGMVQVGYGGFFTRPDSLRTSKIKLGEVHLGESTNHMANFLDAVKSRKDPIAPVEVGHRSATICHLGVISVKLGEKKVRQWNPLTERFVNDDEANKMLSRTVRISRQYLKH